MSKFQTLIALTFILTACGSNSDVSPDSMNTVESTGGSASMISTTGVESTGGSSSESTGSSSTNVAGTSAVIDETGGNQGQTTGGSGPQGTTSTGGSSSTSTTAPKGTGGSSTHGTGGSKATGGSNPGTGGSKATGGSSTQTTGGSKATGGSTQGMGGSNPSTGGSKATGGSAPQATGGSNPSTGGSTPGTGGSAPQATGGSAPQATGGSPSTGGTAPIAQTLYQGISVQALTYPGSENIGIIRTDSISIYWSTVRTSDNRGTAYSSTIRTMPKTGGNPITIVTAPSGSAVGDLVVNGGYIYWMEWVQSTGQVKINKALVNGTSVTTLTTVASPYAGSTRPILLTLRTDGTYLFWVGTPVIQYDTNGYASDTFTRIDKISVNGGAVSTLTTVSVPTWDVTTGGDTSVICYKMITNGVFVLNSTSWYADSRPSIQCSSPSNPQIAYGDLPSFSDAQAQSKDSKTTYAASHVYFPNAYGIANELQSSSSNTFLTSTPNQGGFLTSDTTDLFYVSNETIHQVNISTKSDQPLTRVTSINSITSDGSTLFWVAGVNIYSIPKL